MQAVMVVEFTVAEVAFMVVTDLFMHMHQWLSEVVIRLITDPAFMAYLVEAFHFILVAILTIILAAPFIVRLAATTVAYFRR